MSNDNEMDFNKIDRELYPKLIDEKLLESLRKQSNANLLSFLNNKLTNTMMSEQYCNSNSLLQQMKPK